MADWIASNEAYFPLIPLEENEPGAMGKRLQHGMMTWREKNPVEATEVMSIPDVGEYYRNILIFHHDRFSRSLRHDCRYSESWYFYSGSPMGCGKTEAALAAAEELMAEKQLDGLFFGLPTQVDV